MIPADLAPDRTWAGFRRAALRNVEAAFDNVDSNLIASIIGDIHSRDRIFVAGSSDSHSLLKYLHFLGSMVSSSFRLAEPGDGGFADDILDMNDRDAVICLSSTPEGKTALRVAKLGRERGTLVVGIAESPTTPLAAVSDHLLVVPFQSPSFFRSHVGVLAILETFVGILESASGPAATERIDRIEADRLRLERFRDEGATGA